MMAAEGAAAGLGDAALRPSPIPLSILMRTLNEGDRIEATLRAALPLGAEIVIIDAGSKDKTVELATSLGAKVFHNPWPGFGPQRYFGEEKCSNDLVFSLDADEHLTPTLIAEIRTVFAPDKTTSRPRLFIVKKAVVMPHRDRPPPLGFCHEQVLIYDRRIARTGSNPNWDKLEISATDKPAKLANPLWHYSYRDWNHVVAKWNYVAQLAADTQPARPRWQLLLRLVFEFPGSFLKFYFGRRYFLAGSDGFILSVANAFGRFLRIAKMLERIDQDRSRKS